MRLWTIYNEGAAMELNEWEKENGIEYSQAFLNWYESNLQRLNKLLLSDSMENIRSFLQEHTERERAYWYKIWDSSSDLSYLWKGENERKDKNKKCHME